MGNQVTCDIGADYIELAVRAKPAEQLLDNTNEDSLLDLYKSIEFLAIRRNDVSSFKALPVYSRLHKSLIPVSVSGITYDSFFKDLSEIIEHPVDRAEKFNYTVTAINFFWDQMRGNLFEYELLDIPADGSISVDEDKFKKIPVQSSELYPYLLVSIKSGVSIYRVLSCSKYEKIGGSCLGLNSIWALLKADGNKSFEDLIREAEFGDNSNVDMTVKDIYGTRYLSLPEKITASSCGKLKDCRVVDKRDLTFSLLFMLLFNLGQISAMHCYDLGLTRIVVVGSVFVSDYVNRLMRFTLNYYSKGQLKMIFSENSRYLRCLGMFLNKQRVHRSNTL